jgi:protein-S-isoprenylcysteine O-methyltransferase Ste14
MFHDRYLLVRTASLYVTVMLTAAVWVWRRPSTRIVSGAMLASVWNLPVVLLLHVAAAHFGWWQMDARGGLLLGMPVDLWLAWAWLWGAIPAIAFPSVPLVVVVLIALGADLVLMPIAAPVVRLGPTWLVGEAAGLLAGLLPGQLLARWTARDERLVERAFLQVLAFTGLVLFVLPAIALEGSGGAWLNPLDRPAWQLSLLAQALAAPALLGLTAVQEFVTRGGGTPVPFDPPRRLVTTGVYAYVRNPMQLSAVVLLFLLGIILKNAWVSAAGVMAHLYSAGLAGWDEDEDLRRRFGDEWIAYRRVVPGWRLRFRPAFPVKQPPALLFVAESCEVCRSMGRWFDRRGARQLAVVPAETHPSGVLRRITYEPGDGAPAASGIEAIARALEHIHLGWALIGFLLRLPIVRQLAQLLADASGGEPRRIETNAVAASTTTAFRHGVGTPRERVNDGLRRTRR